MNQHRDFALARLAVVHATLGDLHDDIQQAINLFIDPEEDKDAAERMEILEGAELGLHAAALAMEAAREALEAMSPAERAMGEEPGEPQEEDAA
jgi:hypothetical protein